MANKFAVVTGASTGIGLELAKQFAKNGFDLLVAAEDSGIEQVQAQIGGNVQAVQVDLATPEGVEQLARTIDQTGRPVDAIAINAGVGVNGRFDQTSLDEELRMVRLNVDHTIHLTKRVLPGMIARNSGKILYTASMVSDMPSPYMAAYSGTKAFILNFAEGIRGELKEEKIDGVTISALLPGATDTNFFARAGMQDTKVGQSKKDDPALLAEQGFDGLMRGDDQIMGGSLKNRVMNTVSELIPDRVSATMQAPMNKPGSANKDKAA